MTGRSAEAMAAGGQRDRTVLIRAVLLAPWTHQFLMEGLDRGHEILTEDQGPITDFPLTARGNEVDLEERAKCAEGDSCLSAHAAVRSSGS
jgi:hypothetical protein